jgi:hypothetical protein
VTIARCSCPFARNANWRSPPTCWSRERHFLPDTDPRQLGWKALAVNLSDLAAMGARPRWALLAGSLPEARDGWIAFCRRTSLPAPAVMASI